MTGRNVAFVDRNCTAACILQGAQQAAKGGQDKEHVGGEAAKEEREHAGPHVVRRGGEVVRQREQQPEKPTLRI